MSASAKGSSGKGSGNRKRGSGARAATVRLKTAKGRTISSQRWLQRQLNDPYVQEAQRLGFRSRSAFKLQQLDEKFHFLASGQRVVDLGAAPGGWTQVVAARVLGDSGKGRVVGLDILEMEPLAGAEILQADFMTDEGLAALTSLLGGAADLVLSDMAAPTTGHAPTDHLRTAALCEAAFDFAENVLSPGGAFVAKGPRGRVLAPESLAGARAARGEWRGARCRKSPVARVSLHVPVGGIGI